MSIQDKHNQAIADTDNDQSSEGIDVTIDHSVEAADNGGMFNTGGDTLPLDKADSHGEEHADADTVDKATEADANTVVEADADDTTNADTAPDPGPDSDTISHWDFPVTLDSTALNEITSIIVEDEGDLLGNPDLLDSVGAFLNGDTEFGTDKEKLQAGQELLREFFATNNRAWSGIVGTFTDYAVQIGRLLIALKALVKNCGEKWEPWAAEHLKFLAPRTRQSYMQLAKVPGIDNHLHFGVQRLLPLAGATKGAGGDDPIGDFLKIYNLGFDPEAEIDLDAYKAAVDLALDFERLKKAGLDVDMDSLKKFRADGKTVDAGLIRVLKAVTAANGDPNKHLTNPTGGGPDDGEKKAKSFKKMATTLAGTIDWIADHREFIEQVDVAMIDELTTKLAALKRMIDASDATEAKV